MNSLIGVLVDQSNSMRGNPLNAIATVDGFNMFVETQKIRADDCVFWAAVFDDYLMPVQEFVPLADAWNWGGGSEPGKHMFEYYPGGYTQLFKRTNETILKFRKHIAALPKEERPVSVTLVIQTDGEEKVEIEQRSSDGRNRTTDHIEPYNDVVKAIEEAKADGWRFIFLAAGAGAAKTGALMGIDPHWIVTYQAGAAAKEVFETASIAILEELVAPGSKKGI